MTIGAVLATVEFFFTRVVLYSGDLLYQVHRSGEISQLRGQEGRVGLPSLTHPRGGKRKLPTNTGNLSDTSESSPRCFEVKLSFWSQLCLISTSAFYLAMGEGGGSRQIDIYLDATLSTHRQYWSGCSVYT